MLADIKSFKGAVPRAHPRLLPNDYAQIARNTRLNNGAIDPIRVPISAHTFATNVLSAYYDGATWYGWASIVSVAPAPIAANRLYFTGDGVPKMKDTGTDYNLALPAPTAAPTVALASGTVDTTTEEAVLYAYTFVTGFGEESAPSPASAEAQWSAGVTFTISGFSTPVASRNVTSIRIYRSQTDAAGTTTLYYVAEIAVGTASYTHDVSTAPLQEPLPSNDFDTPPDTLQGLIAMPNGFFAAFTGKQLYFSEPYQPHAWPLKYMLTVDHDIVALCAFGSSIAIVTTGTPYVGQGTDPSSFALEKMDANLPCVSARGIVDMGYRAFYPSNDGLVEITSSGAKIVSEPLFTREQWIDMSPATFVGANSNGRYLFTYLSNPYQVFSMGGADMSTFTGTIYDGGSATGPGTGFTSYDFGVSTSVFGAQRLGQIDTRGDFPFFIDSDVYTPAAMFTRQEDGKVYLLDGTTDVSIWDDPAAAFATQIWRSKLFISTFDFAFGAIMIETDQNLASGDVFACRLIGDGFEKARVTDVNKPLRLPNTPAKRWEIEVQSSVAVSRIIAASTMDELMEAA